jgi:hypothetical protein
MGMEKIMKLKFIWFRLMDQYRIHPIIGDRIYKEIIDERLSNRKKLWPIEENKKYEIKNGRGSYGGPSSLYTKVRKYLSSKKMGSFAYFIQIFTKGL